MFNVSLVSSDFGAIYTVSTSVYKIVLFFVAGCVPLQNDVGGIWAPSYCSSGSNNQGAVCKLQCNKDYELRGSLSVQCTDKGWNSTNGNNIPTCQREYGCVTSALGFLLSRVEN
jgi:hypothetical protein